MGRRSDPGSEVNVVSDVALVGKQRRPCVEADAHLDRAGRERLRERRGGCNRTRRRGEREEERVALRVHLDAAPAAQASRITRRCSARASAYASAPSSCSSFVEPSTSVKRKVTVPDGRSVRTGVMMRGMRVYVTAASGFIGSHVARELRIPYFVARRGRPRQCGRGVARAAADVLLVGEGGTRAPLRAGPIWPALRRAVDEALSAGERASGRTGRWRSLR